MKKYIFLSIVLILFPATVYGETYWGGEVPTMSDTAVEAAVTPDGDIYTFSYSVHNGSGNTGNVRRFHIEITKPRGGMELSGEGLPSLPSRSIIGDEYMVNTVPVGIFPPEGWWPGFHPDGYAWWGGPVYSPGQSLSGYQITSKGLPGIRNFWVEPELEISPYEISVEEEIAFSYRVSFKGKTIGPTAPPVDSEGVFNPKTLFEMIAGYMDESVTLGWLIDNTFIIDLYAKLDAVRQAMDNNNPSLAKIKLGEFMALLDSSSASQRTSAGYGLLYFNAKYLLDNMPISLTGDHYLIELFADKSSLTIGEGIELTARITNNGIPVPNTHTLLEIDYRNGIPLNYRIMSSHWMGWTDSNGEFVFSWQYEDFYDWESLWILHMGLEPLGSEETFKFLATAMNTYLWTGPPIASNLVEATWSGGPDLAIKLFSPPVIIAQGGSEITVTETTANKGNIAAGPSVTRYYLSEDETIDPATDRIIGERQIESLEPGMDSDSVEQTFIMPSDLAEGTYFMWGCADADGAVAETYEQNNCLKNQVVTQIAIPIGLTLNQPPLCDQAFASITSLWPANHKTVKTGIVGVTDPDGDEIAILITGITQDEPVNGLGDGDASPDGFGVGLSKAELRAERSGKGNGRVYAIQFAADDGNGGQCTGSVNVSVPRDKGKSAAAINDGQNYDSTLR